eukprot:912904-Rhodomonas_salina.1
MEPARTARTTCQCVPPGRARSLSAPAQLELGDRAASGTSAPCLRVCVHVCRSVAPAHARRHELRPQASRGAILWSRGAHTVCLLSWQRAHRCPASSAR